MVDLGTVPTPCYVVDEAKLLDNVRLLRAVADAAGAKVLLAQKAFSMFSMYGAIGPYLDGTAASGLFEARLGHDHMGKETHVFAAAYRPDEIDEVLAIADHVVFNSFSEWERYRERAMASGKRIGMRINPERSTQDHAIYDPCAPMSRLGVTRANFREDLLEGISGLHFHTLCEQDSDALMLTLDAVEEKFGDVLARMEWVNFGGGHHITRAGYGVDALVERTRAFARRYGVQVYLEPGEAVALNAGVLVATVLDVVENGGRIAILDASAACHMPDVIEMPYRPPVRGSGEPGEKRYTYRLAGPTCLAGDVIGDYSFDEALKAGDRVVFGDMAIYTMVKNNTFNGMRLPGIATSGKDAGIRMVKAFGYEDFKERLS